MKSSLNLIYRVIWSDKNNAWVVTSELTKSKSKKSQKSVCFDSAGKPSALESFTGKLRSIRFLSGLVAVAGLTFSSLSTALPFGYEVIFGKMTTDTQGANMSIHQGSQKLIANWHSFDIAQGEKVSLFQPNGGAALFRILGNNATQIFGQLDATANLFLFNPNGIYFGKTANVNVGSIVASTLDIKNQDFLNGHYAFAGQGHYGNVTNDGVIHAGKEGYIVLLGESVTNNGTLVANNGSVVLGSANKAVLDFYGNGMLHVKLSGDALNAYVTNTGNIEADGGIVQMATSARSAAINTSGIVQAHNLVERDGVIRLEAGATGTATVAGTLDVSGADSHGGTVAVLGDQVALMDGAYVNATGATGGGKVLVGGNYQGKGPEQNASATYVAQGAVINASATKNGNGGKVIVWGNDYMQSHGNIIARGGEYSGNGGFVETSSHGEFAVTSAPNVGASHGLAGTWLIDPLDLTINNSSTSSVNGATPFAPTGAGATIQWSVINTALGTGDVTVTTATTTGPQLGDITVSQSGVLTNTGKLTLNAANNINLNADITAAGSLDFISNLVVTSGTRTIKTNGAFASNADIVTNGGNITITAANSINVKNIYTTTSATVPNTPNSVSGRVVLSTSNNASSIVAGNIDTHGKINGDGGAVTVSAAGANSTVQLGDVTTSGGALLAGENGRNGGAVNILATGAVVVGNITSNGVNGSLGNNGGSTGVINVTSSDNDVTVGAIQALAGSGGIGQTVRLTAGRDITLEGSIDVSSTATDYRRPAVLINAKGNFINQNDSMINTAGRWLVYSSRPDQDVRGAELLKQADFVQYGLTYDPFDPANFNPKGSGDGFIYAFTPTITVSLVGTASKPFDGNNSVLPGSGLSMQNSLTFESLGDKLGQNQQAGQFTNVVYDTPLVGIGKAISATFTAADSSSYQISLNNGLVDIPVYGYGVESQNSATGVIFIDTSPRNVSGLGTLPNNLNLYSGLTVVPLNPAAGDDNDPDYVPCPEPSDKIGRTPVLDSGLKLPDSIIATCI